MANGARVLYNKLVVTPTPTMKKFSFAEARLCFEGAEVPKQRSVRDRLQDLAAQVSEFFVADGSKEEKEIDKDILTHDDSPAAKEWLKKWTAKIPYKTDVEKAKPKVYVQKSKEDPNVAEAIIDNRAIILSKEEYENPEVTITMDAADVDDVSYRDDPTIVLRTKGTQQTERSWEIGDDCIIVRFSYGGSHIRIQKVEKLPDGKTRMTTMGEGSFTFKEGMRHEFVITDNEDGGIRVFTGAEAKGEPVAKIGFTEIPTNLPKKGLVGSYNREFGGGQKHSVKMTIRVKETKKKVK